MHSLITTLPSETIALVLLNLNQRDQVECMRVCRHWYNEIPHHVSETWKTLRIARDSWPTMNDCVLSCLHYTKHVVLQVRPTCEILEKLNNAGCHLTTLDVTSRLSPSEDFSKLISRITSFGNTLTKLTIGNMCTSVMSEHELLDRCPRLTHLTLLLDYMYMMQSTRSQDNNDYRPTKLVYLHLDNAFICEGRHSGILGRSPDLEVLIVTIHHSRIASGALVPEVDFNSMIDTCPRLQYISWKEIEHPGYFTWLPWKGPTKGPASFSGFSFQGDIHRREQALPILQRSRNTLQYLKLCNLRSISDPPISSVQFPALKALHFSMSSISDDPWLSFLNGCPNLKNLKLELPSSNLDELRAISEGINSLKHLQKLGLTNTSNRMQYGVFLMLSPSPTLQELCLLDMPMSDQGLTNLGDLPSLRKFTIRLTVPGITTKGLSGFARKIKDKPLTSLTFIHMGSLDDMILSELAQAEHLKSLVVAYNGLITDKGVSDLTRKGKDVFLTGCPSASRDGAWKKEV